ncbi:MAG TPA: ATP-binding protein [Candidatus Krumholzibacteria bacterium]|nr:ATP-binding protein [Candidatus Krumholzibacteria bacterium]
MIGNRHHNRGLAARFGLALCAGTAVILVAGGYASLRLQRSHLTDLVETRAIEVADVIRRSTRDAMMRDDPGEVRRIIDAIADHESFERIRVFDARGRITVSTAGEEVGTLVDMDAEQCVLCHGAGQPLARLDGDDRTRVFRSPGGDRVLGVIAPLHNEPSCANAECHAHPTSTTVLGVLDVQLPLARVDADLAASERQIFLGVGIAVLALLALAWLLTWRMVLKPVANLTRAARRVSEGDFSERLDTGHHGEISALTQSWNAMTERLGAARRDLEELNATLERRVAEKTEQLEQAHQRMMLVDKMASLGKLAATVAHEINNPLAGIATYAKLLRRRSEEAHPGVPAGPAEDDLRRILALIEGESQRCGNIVRNLLLFSRTPTVRFTEEDLRPLLDRCTMLLRHRAELSEVSLVVDMPPQLPKVECDASQVQQMVLALAINGLEATAQGGQVIITAREDEPDAWVTIGVRDNGRGIPPEHLADIFEPFFTTKEGESGVGLGLPVVYGIATRHHGTVTVESKPGVGTVFFVRLPVHQPRTADAEASDKEVHVS